MEKIEANSAAKSIKTEGGIDLTRRAIIVGGASALASFLLFGCRAQQTQSSKTGNLNIGVDGRDYSVQPPVETAREILLEARQSEIEIAPKRTVKAWTYDGKLPGTEIRVREGERVRITLKNNLPQDASIHWHGQLQRGTNNMDGVPGVTQAPILPGASFVYDFRAEPSGSFIYHPHTGLQIERGLYGAFIVEPKLETLSYDREYVVMLDDWLEGAPEEAAEKLKRGEMQMGGMSDMNGGGMEQIPSVDPEGAGGGGKFGANSPAEQMEDGADVAYSTFLINGRAPESPFEFLTKRGERVRLRVINPSGSTIYRFAVAGHKLTVTHADGLPVKPVELETFEIAPGERYDCLITADNPGVWAIVAVSADEPDRAACALLRYTDARATSAPSVKDMPNELKGRLLNYNQLAALEPAPAPDAPERLIEMTLDGQMFPYVWTINGKTYAEAEPFEIRAGERVRVSMRNKTMMRHPMHLHGHSFRVLSENAGNNAPLKDTMIVEPMKRAEFDFAANNPGDWVFHCHHAYHLEAGMMRLFKYV